MRPSCSACLSCEVAMAEGVEIAMGQKALGGRHMRRQTSALAL